VRLVIGKNCSGYGPDELNMEFSRIAVIPINLKYSVLEATPRRSPIPSPSGRLSCKQKL